MSMSYPPACGSIGLLARWLKPYWAWQAGKVESCVRRHTYNIGTVKLFAVERLQGTCGVSGLLVEAVIRGLKKDEKAGTWRAIGVRGGGSP